MNPEAVPSPRRDWRRIVKLAIGIIGFGLLMGIRGELDEIWQRALIAAVAGVLLAWAIWSPGNRG